jgi:hypothetical protein
MSVLHMSAVRLSLDAQHPCQKHASDTQIVLSVQDVSAIPNSVSQLPIEAIACILQHVPLQERLGSCSLVSTTWMAAAVTATSSATKSLTNELWHPVMGWISTQQPLLTSLHLSRGESSRQNLLEGPDQLPLLPAPPAVLRTLKKLRLEDLDLCIPLWLHVATGLTRLELAGCYLGVSLDGCMACIAALPNLQELQFCAHDMGPCTISYYDDSSLEDNSPASSSRWGCLSTLTHVHLNGNAITRSADTLFPQLASLTHLKELLLPTHMDTYWQHCYDLTNLEPLQQLTSITRLRLPLFFEEDIFGQYPEALTDLRRGDMDEVFVLSSVSILAASLPDLKHLELVCDDVAEQGNIIWSRVWRRVFVDLAHLKRLELECDYVTADIMASLSHLTKLTALRLHQRASGPNSVSQRAPCIPPSAFAALTSSSNLQFLDVSSVPVSAYDWPFVFPAHRRMPLQDLSITQGNDYCLNALDKALYNAASLQDMVSCSMSMITSLTLQPAGNLTHMAVLEVAGYTLSPLLQLSGLCKLHIKGETLFDGSMTEELFHECAQLTGLQMLTLELGVFDADILPAALPLTALTRLTALTLTWRVIHDVEKCNCRECCRHRRVEASSAAPGCSGRKIVLLQQVRVHGCQCPSVGLGKLGQLLVRCSKA